MERMKVTTIAAGLALLGAAAVHADQTVKARLHGYNEPPAVSTMGSGEFTATLHDDSIEYELSYSGLNSAAFQAHIHLGQANVNGGVSAFLCGGAGKPPCPAGTGEETVSVSGTITPADVIGPAGQGIAQGEFDELLRAIRSGVTYANVHSATQPGGEIRGQIREDQGKH